MARNVCAAQCLSQDGGPHLSPWLPKCSAQNTTRHRATRAPQGFARRSDPHPALPKACTSKAGSGRGDVRTGGPHSCRCSIRYTTRRYSDGRVVNGYEAAYVNMKPRLEPRHDPVDVAGGRLYCVGKCMRTCVISTHRHRGGYCAQYLTEYLTSNTGRCPATRRTPDCARQAVRQWWPHPWPNTWPCRGKRQQTNSVGRRAAYDGDACNRIFIEAYGRVAVLVACDAVPSVGLVGPALGSRYTVVAAVCRTPSRAPSQALEQFSRQIAATVPNIMRARMRDHGSGHAQAHTRTRTRSCGPRNTVVATMITTLRPTLADMSSFGPCCAAPSALRSTSFERFGRHHLTSL